MKKKVKKKIESNKLMLNEFLLIGIVLFIFLCFLFLIPNILFFLKIPMNKFYFPVACILLVYLSYLLANKDKKKTALISIVCLALIMSSIYLSGKIIDTSVDGNSYRKIMAGLTEEGWNPIYESAKSYNKKLNALPMKLSVFGNKSQWFWMDVYPKSLSTFASTISIITGDIETGKCYTLLTMFIIFFLYSHYLTKFLKKHQSIMLATLLALNPVSMCQLRSFYVDAALSNIILIALAFILLYFNSESKMKKWYLLLISLSIVYVFNIKFNGVLFIGLLCIAMWIIQLYKDKKIKNYAESKKIFITFACTVIISLLIGFSPYITNIYRYNEFLPGITGNSTKATGNVTKSTKNLKSPQVFFVNIFSKVGDYWADEKLPLKVPFTTSKEEINNYYIHASNFGTFGALFSGLFIIIVILSTSITIIKRKQLLKDEQFRYIFIFLWIIILQCVLSPIGFGGLRYVAHFYIILIYTLGISLYYINKNPNKLLKKINMFGVYIIVLISLLNIAPYFKIYLEEIVQEKISNYTLSTLAEERKGKKLTIALSVDSSHGILLNLRDFGIEYKDYNFVNKEKLGDDPTTICSYQIQYKLENE